MQHLRVRVLRAVREKSRREGSGLARGSRDVHDDALDRGVPRFCRKLRESARTFWVCCTEDMILRVPEIIYGVVTWRTKMFLCSHMRSFMGLPRTLVVAVP